MNDLYSAHLTIIFFTAWATIISFNMFWNLKIEEKKAKKTLTMMQ